MITERSREKFVHILLSFALGGLLGDVFFHTLPHLMESNSTHSHGDHSGHHHHSEETMNNNLVIIFGLLAFFLIEKLVHNYFEPGGHSHSDKDDAAEAEHQKELRFKKFAVISMIGDFVHNFTDGLSIGVSYVVDYKMGLVTSMAMFFHEIPHEVGDFAILFQLKYSVWQIVAL